MGHELDLCSSACNKAVENLWGRLVITDDGQGSRLMPDDYDFDADPEGVFEDGTARMADDESIDIGMAMGMMELCKAFCSAVGEIREDDIEPMAMGIAASVMGMSDSGDPDIERFRGIADGCMAKETSVEYDPDTMTVHVTLHLPGEEPRMGPGSMTC